MLTVEEYTWVVAGGHYRYLQIWEKRWWLRIMGVVAFIVKKIK